MSIFEVFLSQIEIKIKILSWAAVDFFFRESRLLVPGLEELRAERAESLISAELRAEIEQREEQ